MNILRQINLHWHSNLCLVFRGVLVLMFFNVLAIMKHYIQDVTAIFAQCVPISSFSQLDILATEVVS